jgi:hypothetical protein
MDNWLFPSLFQNRIILDAAIALGLFWAALSRPKRIHRAGLFRWAVILFCLAVVTPVINQLVMYLTAGPGNTPGVGRIVGTINADSLTTSLILAVIPVFLTALSVYFAIEAVRPQDHE